MSRFDDQYTEAKFSRSPEFGTNILIFCHWPVLLFLEIPEFPFNTVKDRWKEAPVPKTSSIHSAVSKKHRLVTDGQTDTGPQLVVYRASKELRG